MDSSSSVVLQSVSAMCGWTDFRAVILAVSLCGSTSSWHPCCMNWGPCGQILILTHVLAVGWGLSPCLRGCMSKNPWLWPWQSLPFPVSSIGWSVAELLGSQLFFVPLSPPLDMGEGRMEDCGILEALGALAALCITYWLFTDGTRKLNSLEKLLLEKASISWRNHCLFFCHKPLKDLYAFLLWCWERSFLAKNETPLCGHCGMFDLNFAWPFGLWFFGSVRWFIAISCGYEWREELYL